MDPETPRAFEGTSAATAFTAGVVALAESVWGQRYSNSELRQMLKQSNRTLEEGGDPILDAAAFLRQKLVLARDDEEPNDVLGDVEARPPALPKVETAYKLTTDSDTDLFPIQFPACTSTSVEMHYVADWEDMTVASAISLAILNADGTVKATGARTALGTFTLTGATLDANKKYYLKVSNVVPTGSPKALPTAYDLNLTTSACAP